MLHSLLTLSVLYVTLSVLYVTLTADTLPQIEINREYRLHRTHYETVVASEFQCSRSVCLRTTFNPGTVY